MAAPTKGTELSTIDVNMIVVTTEETEPRSLASTTQTKIEVEPQIETTEAVKNIVKGRLLAQKSEIQTITGNTITLTDNTTILELIEILQGGTVTKESESGEITGYTPPVVGSEYKPVKFSMDVYSAVMDEGGNIVKYEKITYPGCKGAMVGLGGEDNVFRVNTYTINSAPAKGQAPYAISYADELPTVS